MWKQSFQARKLRPQSISKGDEPPGGTTPHPTPLPMLSLKLTKLDLYYSLCSKTFIAKIGSVKNKLETTKTVS